MSYSYINISIEKVVSDAKKNFITSGHFLDDPGNCGVSQSTIYYSAIKNGVPKHCIKLCQASDIIQSGVRHTFVILILDIPYLVDLNFGQFLCLFSKDKNSNLLTNVFPSEKISEFYENGFIPLTERFLIAYYTLLHRNCYEPIEAQHNKHLDSISLHLNEQNFEQKDSVNFLEATLTFDWENKGSNNCPSISIEDIEEFGYDWLD